MQQRRIDHACTQYTIDAIPPPRGPAAGRSGGRCNDSIDGGTANDDNTRCSEVVERNQGIWLGSARRWCRNLRALRLKRNRGFQNVERRASRRIRRATKPERFICRSRPHRRQSAVPSSISSKIQAIRTHRRAQGHHNRRSAATTHRRSRELSTNQQSRRCTEGYRFGHRLTIHHCFAQGHDAAIKQGNQISNFAFSLERIP